MRLTDCIMHSVVCLLMPDSRHGSALPEYLASQAHASDTELRGTGP